MPFVQPDHWHILRARVRLLIISNMPHYLTKDGTVVGWAPTAHEIDQLAGRFDEVRHIATLHEGEPPRSYVPYSSPIVELIPMRPTGGDELRQKLGVLAALPSYTATMLRELRRADVVHLRCPANLPMVGATLLPFVRGPKVRWLKYAGDWRPGPGGSRPFAYQRWLLAKRWHRGVVTINGHWDDQPAHVKSFFNPSLEDDDLGRGSEIAAKKSYGAPLRLLFVGRLWHAKGCDVAIDTLARLRGLGIDATLEIAGDGDERAAYVERCRQHGLLDRVTFYGWLERDPLEQLYAKAHFLLFPSRSEGWPKVLSEGMAFGVIPIASAVGAIEQYLHEFGVGVSLRDASPQTFAHEIAAYDADRWRREVTLGLAAARNFSYSHYLSEVDHLLAMAAR